MYAVVRTGGKQMRVSPGEVVDIELVAGNPGDRLELSEVLLVGGDALKVGSPLVAGAKVIATIQAETKGPRVKGMKYKRRKRYKIRLGHRQHYTRVKIDAIEV